MSKSENTHFLKQFSIRNDDFGLGHFGAPRTHGTHKGVDILVKHGELIKAPFNAIVERTGFVYVGDLNYRLIVLKGLDAYYNYQIKIFYVQPLIDIGLQVKQGDIIGYAQSISAKYGDGMKDHLHIEVYNADGKLINPEIFF